MYQQMPAPSIFGEPTKTLSVVVPAYNEEERLTPMLEEMLAYLQKRRDRQVGSSPNVSVAHQRRMYCRSRSL